MQRTPDSLDADDSALFLDVDGTLIDIEPHPDDVRADRSLVDLLCAVSRGLNGAMALVSGRSIAALDRIFAPARFPAAGAHGTEFRTTGDAPADSGALALPAGVMDRLEAFVRQRDGLLLEAKAGGASLHYRQAPEREHEARAFVDSLLSVISADYRLIDGKMVLELAPRHHDKGEAIRTLLAAAPFSGRRPVFVGDDVTDEDGFNAVNELGGTSIHVGEQMNTAARCRLADVAAVRAWLRDSAGRDPAGQQHS